METTITIEEMLDNKDVVARITSKLSFKMVGIIFVVLLIVLATLEKAFALDLLIGFGIMAFIGIVVLVYFLGTLLFLSFTYKIVINRFLYFTTRVFSTTIPGVILLYLMLAVIPSFSIDAFIYMYTPLFEKAYKRYLLNSEERDTQTLFCHIGMILACLMTISTVKTIYKMFGLLYQNATARRYAICRIAHTLITMIVWLKYSWTISEYLGNAFFVLATLYYSIIFYKINEILCNDYVAALAEAKGVTNKQLSNKFEKLQKVKKHLVKPENLFLFVCILHKLPKWKQSEIWQMKQDYDHETAFCEALEYVMKHNTVNHILRIVILAGEDQALLSILDDLKQASLLSVEDLKSQTGVTDAQLDTEIIDSNQQLLAGCFDNYKDYLDKLGLNQHEKSDMQRIEHMQGHQAAMRETLILWKKQYSFAPTYRSLVNITLELGKEQVATKICQHVAQH